MKKKIEIKRKFEESITIVITPHYGFTMPTSALIQSIIENSSSNNNYDIVIFHVELKDDDIKIIMNQIDGMENFSIRIINISQYLFDYAFFHEKNNFRAGNYYRLLIPFLMRDYKKIVYLDADTVVEHDIADFFNNNITNYMVGAVKDFPSNFEVDEQEELKKYRHQVLLLKDAKEYFNAGVLLMNLEEFRSKFTDIDIIGITSSRNWRSKDQDILNYLTHNNGVKFLDYKFNFMVGGRKDSVEHYTEYDKEQIKSALNDLRIIHYTGANKPWLHLEVPCQDIFWKYAKKTPYKDALLKNVNHDSAFDMIASDILNNRFSGIQLLKLFNIFFVHKMKSIFLSKKKGINN